MYSTVSSIKEPSKLRNRACWVYYEAKRKAIIGSKLQLKCKELLYSSMADISLCHYTPHMYNLCMFVYQIKKKRKTINVKTIQIYICSHFRGMRGKEGGEKKDGRIKGRKEGRGRREGRWEVEVKGEKPPRG